MSCARAAARTEGQFIRESRVERPDRLTLTERGRKLPYICAANHHARRASTLKLSPAQKRRGLFLGKQLPKNDPAGGASGIMIALKGWCENREHMARVGRESLMSP